MDVARDRIVELAATQGHDLAHLPGASFSEIVHVPSEIQRSASAQAAAEVHGISDDEIALGTSFPVSWARFPYRPQANWGGQLLYIYWVHTFQMATATAIQILGP